MLGQRAAQLRVCFIIQSAGGIVQNQYFRTAGQRARDKQALLLPA